MPPRSRTTEVDASDADASTETKEAAVAETPKAEEKKADESGSSSSGTEYLNTTSGPVVYDREGHMIGGGEWITLSGLDAIGKSARSNGYLVPRSAL